MQTPDNQNDRVWLTPLLNRIADVAGVEAALALGRAKAGQQISIPSQIRPGHWLSELVGHRAAIGIAGAFGGQKLTMPATLIGAKRQRAEAIAALAAKGYSLNKIAELTGLSRSTIRVHVDRVREPSKQGELF